MIWQHRLPVSFESFCTCVQLSDAKNFSHHRRHPGRHHRDAIKVKRERDTSINQRTSRASPDLKVSVKTWWGMCTGTRLSMSLCTRIYIRESLPTLNLSS